MTSSRLLRLAAYSAASLMLNTLCLPAIADSSKTKEVRVDEIADLEVLRARDVRMAGDVNGDGFGDAMVEGTGYPTGTPGTWVLFGPLQGVIDVDESMEGKGFFIEHGPSFVGEFGGACDVNGDGLSDVILGASGASNNERPSSGAAYVVFGKADDNPVDSALWDQDQQGDAGFRIDGAKGGATTGRAVAPVGDINGDGLCDIAVASPFIGATYIVFGKTGNAPIDLLDFHQGEQGDAGYLIDTPDSDSADDYSVAGAGDVNGDSIPDIVVGVVRHVHGAGNAYVVFGKTDDSRQDVATLGGGGFRFIGAHKYDAVGYWVESARDVNGDGLSDVFVGRSRHFHGRKPGGAFVIYGSTLAHDLKASWLEKGHTKSGFLIKSTRSHDDAGIMVAPLGDVTGDGRSDLLIAAESDSAGGAIYVIKGRAYRKSVILSELGDKGVRIEGAAEGDQIGIVAGDGDINADNLPDLLIGEVGPNRPMNVWGIYGTSLRDLITGP